MLDQVRCVFPTSFGQRPSDTRRAPVCARCRCQANTERFVEPPDGIRPLSESPKRPSSRMTLEPSLYSTTTCTAPVVIIATRKCVLRQEWRRSAREPSACFRFCWGRLACPRRPQSGRRDGSPNVCMLQDRCSGPAVTPAIPTRPGSRRPVPRPCRPSVRRPGGPW